MTDAQARELLQMRRDNWLKAGNYPRGTHEYTEMDWGVIYLDRDGVFHDVPMASAVGTLERAAEKQAWNDTTERLPATITPENWRAEKLMARTTVVNLCREPYDVYIGRPGQGHDGYFGNPFRVPPGAGARKTVLARYREWFLQRVDADPEFRRRVLALRGKVLGCFCKPAACHGDVIAEWLDSQSGG